MPEATFSADDQPTPTTRHTVRPELIVAFLGLALIVTAMVLTARGQLLGLVLGNGLLIPYTDERYRTTVQTGDEIIAALERWRAAKGDYPDTLSALVPSELPELKRPQVGSGRWEFAHPAPGQFELGFFVGPIYESDLYESTKGEWHVDR